jgi:hypothetical protein
MILTRLVRVRALFGSLRHHRHDLFDDVFQEQLKAMYRQTGAGDPAPPPALLCMALLLQGYVGASDAEAIELCGSAVGGIADVEIVPRGRAQGASRARAAPRSTLCVDP